MAFVTLDDLKKAQLAKRKTKMLAMIDTSTPPECVRYALPLSSSLSIANGRVSSHYSRNNVRVQLASAMRRYSSVITVPCPLDAKCHAHSTPIAASSCLK